MYMITGETQYRAGIRRQRDKNVREGGEWVWEAGDCDPPVPSPLTELCSFWYGLKVLFTLHKLADKVVLDR